MLHVKKLANFTWVFFSSIFFTRLFLLLPTCLSLFSTDSGKYHNLFLLFLHPRRIILFFVKRQWNILSYMCRYDLHHIVLQWRLVNALCLGIYVPIFMYLGTVGDCDKLGR